MTNILKATDIEGTATTIDVPGYEYAPWSVVSNPDMLGIVKWLGENGPDDVDGQARFLYNHTVMPKLPRGKSLGYRQRSSVLFANANSAQCSAVEQAYPKDLPKIYVTKAMLTLALSKLEYAYRLQGVIEPEEEFEDTGLGEMTAATLSRLSNVYRGMFDVGLMDAYGLRLSQSMLQYATRFNGPDRHGYEQTLGHYIHLSVLSVDERQAARFPDYEQRLRFALELTELSEGAEVRYRQHITRDLMQLWRLTDREAEADALDAFYDGVPTLQRPPEAYHNKVVDARRGTN